MEWTRWSSIAPVNRAVLNDINSLPKQPTATPRKKPICPQAPPFCCHLFIYQRNTYQNWLCHGFRVPRCASRRCLGPHSLAHQSRKAPQPRGCTPRPQGRCTRHLSSRRDSAGAAPWPCRQRCPGWHCGRSPPAHTPSTYGQREGACWFQGVTRIGPFIASVLRPKSTERPINCAHSKPTCKRAACHRCAPGMWHW